MEDYFREYIIASDEPINTKKNVYSRVARSYCYTEIRKYVKLPNFPCNGNCRVVTIVSDYRTVRLKSCRTTTTCEASLCKTSCSFGSQYFSTGFAVTNLLISSSALSSLSSQQNSESFKVSFRSGSQMSLSFGKNLLRDRPFNLQGGYGFFVSFRIFHSDNTRVRTFIFFVALSAIFFYRIYHQVI